MICRWEETPIGQRCVVCDREIRLSSFMPQIVATCRGTRLPSGPCQYRGAEVERVKPPGCKCQEPVPIYSCGLLDRCSERPMSGVAWCFTCPSYSRTPQKQAE